MKKLLPLVLLWACAAVAQDSGQISGIVEDQSGACIPKARIMLIEVRRLQTWQATTDNECKFNFTGLEPGDYELRVAKTWFQPYRKELRLKARKPVFVKAKLRFRHSSLD